MNDPIANNVEVVYEFIVPPPPNRRKTPEQWKKWSRRKCGSG
jgi:hypothetical protein